MKNILLPTDFSANSKNANEYALQLFKGELCTFYFLHIQKISNYTTDDLMVSKTGTSLHQSVLENPKKELTTFVNMLKVKRPCSNHIYKCLVDYDSFTGGIKQAVERKRIDLIVMGSNGASNLEEKIFGSNTLKVLREGICPTLIIPINAPFKIPKNILLPLINDKISEIPSMESLIDLSMKFKSSLNIIDIQKKDTGINNNQKPLSKLENLLKNVNITIGKIKDVSITEAINSSVQLLDIDLVVLLLKKESFIERLIKGSNLDNINYSTKVPLLFLNT